VVGIYMAQDRNQLWALVNTVMKFWFDNRQVISTVIELIAS
jgi:hypothetical protein